MDFIFEVDDKTGRKIHLTKRQWTHITSPDSLHAHMTNYLDGVKEAVIKPDKIVVSIYDDSKVNYYKYNKIRSEYLKVVVKYLNGDGFVITAYFVKGIK